MNREELEKKAKELGIKFNDDTTDEELNALIVDAEKKNNDDNSKDLDYWKNEAKAAFNDRDTAKKDARKLKEKIKELEDAMKDAPSKEEYNELRKSLKELKDFKTEADKRLEEEELKKKTDIERAEINFNKQLQELEARMTNSISAKEEELKKISESLNKKEETIKNLRKSTLSTQIMEAATRFNAYNPTQIVGLLKSEFSYDENLDKFSKDIVDSNGKLKDVMSVEDRVKEFLSDPINDNLIKSKIKTDDLNVNDNKNFKKDEKKFQKETKNYNPKDEDLIFKAQNDGFNDVDEYINVVLKPRDEKMARIRENREKLNQGD